MRRNGNYGRSDRQDSVLRRRPKGPIQSGNKFDKFTPLLPLSYRQKLVLLSGERSTRLYGKKRLNLSDYTQSELNDSNERRPSGGSRKGED